MGVDDFLSTVSTVVPFWAVLSTSYPQNRASCPQDFVIGCLIPAQRGREGATALRPTTGARGAASGAVFVFDRLGDVGDGVPERRIVLQLVVDLFAGVEDGGMVAAPELFADPGK